jgi:acetyl-CoA acetyltransferase
VYTVIRRPRAHGRSGPRAIVGGEISTGTAAAQPATVAGRRNGVENGFCPGGEQERLVAEGAFEIGGRLPVNTDGGCSGTGEPICTSGLRQIREVVLQLRGLAGERQVSRKPKVGYTRLYGAPGTAGVSILSA